VKYKTYVIQNDSKNLNQQNLSLKDISFDGDEKNKNQSKFLDKLAFFTVSISVLLIIIDLGFLYSNTLRIIFNIFYNIALLLGILSLSKAHFRNKKSSPIR